MARRKQKCNVRTLFKIAGQMNEISSDALGILLNDQLSLFFSLNKPQLDYISNKMNQIKADHYQLENELTWKTDPTGPVIKSTAIQTQAEFPDMIIGGRNMGKTHLMNVLKEATRPKPIFLLKEGMTDKMYEHAIHKLMDEEITMELI